MSDTPALDGGTPKRSFPASVASGKPALNRILEIDKHEGLIELAQTARGRALIVVLFAGLLVTVSFKGWQESMFVAMVAATYAYVPRLRGAIVASATVAVLILPFRYSLEGVEAAIVQEGISPLATTAIMRGAAVAYAAMAWIALELARRNKGFLIARRPVVSLLFIEAVLCGLTCLPVAHGIVRVLLWSLLSVLTANIWFLCYGLIDQRARDPMPALFRVGLFHPFSGTSSAPWGKGAAFLKKTQAKTPRELAVTQLKAIKLLVWSLVLFDLAKLVFLVCVVGLHVPALDKVQAAHFAHHPVPLLMGWASLILSTVFGALTLAVTGHQAIALARLAGFRLPRNTYRPLEARSLAEYWNRYYYYFKELLVEFFFLPTFLRTFRHHPRLRVFFATFMAAGVGNAIFHFMLRIGLVASEGITQAAMSFTSYMFYCAVLATAIAISQVRTTSGVPLPTSRWGRVGAFAWIWTFIVCIHIFGDESRVYTLSQRIEFMESLIGIS